MLFVDGAGMPLSHVLLTSLILYTISVAIYRLFISPIAGVPGPKLAALTQWYETYYEMFVKPGGQFMFHYRKLHQKYGPIVRLNPNEVHIDDSQFFHEIYSNTRQWDKPQHWESRFGDPGGTFNTSSHQLHRHRRAALNPFFSKRRIYDYSPTLQEIMNRLCDRINREYKGADTILQLDAVLSCYAADVVVGFCFENENHWIDAPDFHCAYAEGMNSLAKNAHLVTQFPWLARLFNTLSPDVVAKINPSMEARNKLNREVRQQIDHIIECRDSGDQNDKSKTVFTALLDSGLPPQELLPLRLQQEATVIVGAGVETTKAALATGAFHIINTPEIFQKLRAELEEAIPDPDSMPPLDRLEQLPYLSACIQECCRFGYGTSQRSSRVSDHITLQYGSYTLPPGTIISMTNYCVSHDEAIFPDSYSFKPERWLSGETAPDGGSLSRYMVCFGRGTRACLGKQLALAEMYIFMANLYRKFGFELYETDRTAVDCAMDFVVQRPKPDTLGVRVHVK